jgi:hypothetical protein
MDRSRRIDAVRWLCVTALALALGACGDKGQGATGRGVPKVGPKGEAADAGAKAAPKPAPKGLPSAFRGGKSREQVLKMLPSLLGGRFHSSIVVFEARKLFSAWSSVAKQLGKNGLGQIVLRELERERLRAGALLPKDVAEAKRWGIGLDGPSFVVLHNSSRRTVVGYSVADRSKFQLALLKLYDRGRGTTLSWEQSTQGKPRLSLLRQGPRVRAVCVFTRGFAVCARREDAIDVALARPRGSLWDDLDKKERAALATQSGLLTLGERRAALLSFWRLDAKRRMHVSGRAGGHKLLRLFAALKPPQAPRLLGVKGAVATGWVQLPIGLSTQLKRKEIGLDGRQIARGFDGEIALAEDAGGEVSVVLGVRDRKVAGKVVSGLLKQLQTDGMWANLGAFAVSKRKRARDPKVGAYQLIDVRCTEPLLKGLKLRLAVVLKQDRLVIGTPKKALALAAGTSVRSASQPPSRIAKAKARGMLLAAKLPLGDILAPLLRTMPLLLRTTGGTLPQRDIDFVRMVPRSFRHGQLRLRLQGKWLRGEGRLDVAAGGRYDAQQGSAARAGLWALALFVSRIERAERVRHDLYGLRWRLRSYLRRHKRLPLGKSGWLPKTRCCKLPGSICPRSAVNTGPLAAAGFRTYSTAHQWRYKANKKGTKATLEARADLDCDGRFATHRVQIELVNGRVKIGKIESKQRFE